MGLALEAKRYQSAACHRAVPYPVHPPGLCDFFSFYSLRVQHLPRETGKRDREREERYLLPYSPQHSCSSPLTPAILCIHRLTGRHKKPTVGRAASCEPSRVSMVRSFPFKKQFSVCWG